MKNLRILLLIVPLFTFIQCDSNKNKEESISEDSTQNGELAAAVKQNGEWFFINEKGEKLFDKTFTYASQFNDGISCVAEDGERMMNGVIGANYYGINTQGEKIDKIISDSPFMFSEGLAFLTQADRTYLVDTEGEVIKYLDGVEGYVPFFEGRAAVFVDQKIQIWDKNGEVIKDNLDLTVGVVSEGFISFHIDGKHGFLDKDGNVVQEPIYLDSSNFIEGLALVKDESGEWYYINSNFEKFLGPFQDGRDVSENVIAVQQDNLWQFIDKNGNSIIEEKFSEADSFYEGLAIIIRQDQTVGFINKKGDFTPIDARVALGFNNGLAIAEKDMKMGFINTKGEWVIPAAYERVNNFNKTK